MIELHGGGSIILKVCFIGDVCGMAGRRAVLGLLPGFVRSNDIDCIIINAENSAHGLGVSRNIIEDFSAIGCDCITLGNHTFSNRDFYGQIKNIKNCVRPANITPAWPGNDYYIVEKKGIRLGIINLLGQVFMDIAADNPFTKAEELIDKLRNELGCHGVFVDIHGEATSEKQALGYFLDGKATVVAGTHTHVMTADDKILKYGTGYITDCGMTGAYESVLGMDKDVSVKRLAYKIPMRYEPADGPAFMCGIVFETDESGRCLSLRRFCEYE